MTINLVNMGNGTYAIKIGDKFLVDYEGNLECINADVAGTITATSGTIGGCSIVDGKLQIAEANISGKLTANVIDGSNLNVNSANIADSVNANWVYAGAVNADNITAGTLNADRINANTLSWDKLIGYIPYKKVSSEDSELKELFVGDLSAVDISASKAWLPTIYFGTRIGGTTAILDSQGITLNKVLYSWNDIVGKTATAVFG